MKLKWRVRWNTWKTFILSCLMRFYNFFTKSTLKMQYKRAKETNRRKSGHSFCNFFSLYFFSTHLLLTFYFDALLPRSHTHTHIPSQRFQYFFSLPSILRLPASSNQLFVWLLRFDHWHAKEKFRKKKKNFSLLSICYFFLSQTCSQCT